jgi:crotonobetainyl-CoA:carnitine CoA-transferase CaiB-like acyl-CoA transferase
MSSGKVGRMSSTTKDASSSEAPALPLGGFTIIDMTTSYAGPTATMYLADMGAEVIKVERPGEGDDARSWGPPFVGSSSAWFHSANRNKRSIALNLRSQEGREVLDQLLTSADVFVENINPAKLASLHLEPEVVSARHPHLVYCAISGFGLTGPHRDLGGYDLLAQARSGLMSVTGEAGRSPQRVSTALSDIATGLVAAFAVVAVLHQRVKNGRGEVIDVSLLDTDLALMAPRIASYLAGEPEPAPSGATDSVLAVYQQFATADRPIVVAVGNDAIWVRFCEAADLENLALDKALGSNAARRADRPRILGMIKERLATKTSAEWLEIFESAGVPVSLIQGLAEVVNDAQVQARGGIMAMSSNTVTAQVVASPWRLSGRVGGSGARLLDQPGADTVEVLRSHGFGVDEIEALFCSGAVGPIAETWRISEED